MKMAWKEIIKNKSRFIILGSIVFLVSFLTLIISGLSNGLSQDNAALIKDMPEGTFYMNEDADETYNLSKIDQDTEDKLIKDHDDATALSIQMGFVDDANDKQLGVAFVTATNPGLFPEVADGEILLDESLKDKGVEVGDKLTNNQLSKDFTVKGFVEQQKFSHSPVAFINPTNYQEMYRVEDMQMVFVPGKDESAVNGLQAFSNKDFLNTIPSYSAEQLSLNMIVWFLVVISGMLFGIFFYMMNVQKIGLYGILKAIGVKTSKLFQMMWTQMVVITAVALALSVGLSQLFAAVAPEGMPFHLPLATTGQLAVVFVIIGFIGATLSGIQIKKIQPLQAIQQGEM
ncbi:ABC transporter permease [Virgibacillus sp. MSJ-26]|uniref:ABC transporter permease n=1 Tax=Virgibacillus sp. MSJ-26 TaxID=2841522 RepID=UPI001C0F9119|nr:ABC transporter permease [Virgibacillus sp. MSJ-26]MBU5466163.1 ABC transporter permease [Virgibacillus sp. MSJ-26]